MELKVRSSQNLVEDEVIRRFITRRASALARRIPNLEEVEVRLSLSSPDLAAARRCGRFVAFVALRAQSLRFSARKSANSLKASIEEAFNDAESALKRAIERKQSLAHRA